MADRMPPPGMDKGPTHGVAIVIAPGGDKGGKMPPPGTKTRDPGGKATSEEAGGIMEDQKCVDCQNWHPDTGECDKVEGTWTAEQACVKYFQALAEEQGETPDQEKAEGEAQPAGAQQ